MYVCMYELSIIQCFTLKSKSCKALTQSKLQTQVSAKNMQGKMTGAKMNLRDICTSISNYNSNFLENRKPKTKNLQLLNCFSLQGQLKM